MSWDPLLCCVYGEEIKLAPQRATLDLHASTESLIRLSLSSFSTQYEDNKTILGTMEGSPDVRIVLLGKTGAGKSSTGNSILGEDVFSTSDQANSQTSKCEAKTKIIDGKKITVIDTPGYFATERSDEELKPEITKCIVECAPGPHAFLIVLTVTRQTAEEKKVVEEILKQFGKEALKYAVVMFTHGDQLANGKTIHQFVDENVHLKRLVQKCGGRLHVIDNKYWNNPIKDQGDETRNAKEIKKLWNTIDQMMKQNRDKHYTNEMLQSVARAIEDEKAKGKTVEMAKQSVMKRISILAAGVLTGILLGALLGVVTVGVIIIGLAIKGRTSTVVAAPAATAVGLKTIAAAGTGIGVIVGGLIGAVKAQEAESPIEAAEGTFQAITEPAMAAVKLVKDKIVEEIKGYTKMGNPPF